MESDDNHLENHRSEAALVKPLNDMARLQQALEDYGLEKMKLRPTIVRHWSKTHVDQITGNSSKIITIRATCLESNDQEEFPINKGLLCQFSAYFRAVFMGEFAESKQKSLNIKLRPDDMRVFTRWLGSGKLCSQDGVPSYRPDNSVLIRLYTFADYYDIPALRRAIMLRFASPYEWERSGIRVSEWQLGKCLAELPTTSTFYVWLVEHWAHCHSSRLGRKMRQNEDIPQEIRDLV